VKNATKIVTLMTSFCAVYADDNNVQNIFWWQVYSTNDFIIILAGCIAAGVG